MRKRGIYTVGGTVQAAGGRYITRAVDDELIQNCQNGDFSFVLTARQMGKSSLMVRTAQRLAHEGIRSAIVDLSQIGVQITEDAWYLGILTRIEDSLDLNTNVYDWWDKHSQLGHGHRFSFFFEKIVLSEVTGQLVVFMDEVDSTLSLPFTDDFFAAIRYIYNSRANTTVFQRLSFVLVGVATPSDLISDPVRTPFNIGKQVDIDYFTASEALPLAEGFQAEQNESRKIFDWILRWTNGHPFLTQRLSAEVANADPLPMTKAKLDQVVSKIFFGDQSEHDSNLHFVHDMLTRRAEDPTEVLAIYQRIIKGKNVQDDRQSSAVTHLKLSGIVAQRSGHLRIRNRIYEHVFDGEWLARQWPEHWLKRVPPAVIGLVAASFITVILLGALFLQLQQVNQAEETAAIQTQLSDSLQIQFDITASLNQRLTSQNQTLDSLGLEAEDTNEQLRRLVASTDSLREIEAKSNILLLEQFVIAESLGVQAQTANIDLRYQVRVSDSLANVVQTQLDESAVARLETLTLALANTARRQERLGNAMLGAFLARQAYHFSLKAGGKFIDPIYDALTSTLNAVTTDNEHLVGGPTVIGPLSSGIRSISSSPDVGFLVAGLENGQIAILTKMDDVIQESGSIEAHKGAVRSIALIPSTGQFVSSGDDGRVLIWTKDNTGGYTSDQLIRYRGLALALAISADDQLLATGSSDGELNLWDVQSIRQFYTRTLPSAASIRAIAFRREDNALAFGADDGMIRMMDRYGSPVATWNAGQGRLRSIKFHPNDKSLASSGDETYVRRWMVSDDGVALAIGDLLRGHEGPISSISFDASGTRLASASYDHSIQVWDLTAPSTSSIILQNHNSWVESLIVTNNGKQIVSGGADRTLQIWNLDLDDLANRVCSANPGADLSQADWDQYVGSDFPYTVNYQPCSANMQFSGNNP